MALADLIDDASTTQDQQKMIRRLTAQVEANKQFSGSADLDDLLRRASDARNLVEAERLVLYLVTNGELISKLEGSGQEFRLAVTVPSIPSHVSNTGETVSVADVTDPFEMQKIGGGLAYDPGAFGAIHGVRPKSLLAIPVIYHGMTIGVLEALNKEGDAGFDFLDSECLQETAKTLAPLLHQVTAFQAQQEKLQYTEKLNGIINRIHGAKDVDQILLSVCHDIVAVFGAERITIYAVDEGAQELYSKVKEGNEVKEFRVPIGFESIAGYTAVTSSLVNIADVYEENELVRIHHMLSFNPSYDKATGFRTKQVMAAPLIFEGTLSGVIQIINSKNGEPFDEAAAEAMQTVSDTLAIAMANRASAPVTAGRRTKYTGLIEGGILDDAKLERAQEILTEEPDYSFMDEVFVKEFKIPRIELLESYAKFYRRSHLDIEEIPPAPVLIIEKLEGQYEVLKRGNFCPVYEEDGKIVVVIDDPRNLQATDMAQVILQGKPIDFHVALPQDISKMIDKYFGVAERAAGEIHIDVNMDELMTSFAGGEEQEGTKEYSEDDNEICKLVNMLIVEAHNKGASDIHIEPYLDTGVVIRARVDGDLIELMKPLPAAVRNAISSRIKIMSDLDIAERRKPQDGKIKFRKWGPLDIELRVATVPTQGAMEDVVMRILAASKPIPLAGIGMSPRNFEIFTGLVRNPYGIILCVGPTGSGKTTTLHSALGFINKIHTKIWTAEDPVEITQRGLRQVQINKKAGLDFATVMRSFLRADPDVIMVGEMRDLETTSMGIEASLTGHLVLSTLHTNNAPETVTRLLDMGIDEFSFADALLGVLAQRLGRTLCKDCKEEYHPDQKEFEELRTEYGSEEFWNELGVEYNSDFTLFRVAEKGCDKCNGSGMRGRIGLHELLANSQQIAALIHKRATAEEIRNVALAEGMRTLKQDGLEKVMQGKTTVEAVRKVCIA